MTSKSVTDVFREALKIQTLSATVPYMEGSEAGWAEAVELYGVDYRCARCGGTLTIESAEEKKVAARAMREAGWAHGSVRTQVMRGVTIGRT